MDKTGLKTQRFFQKVILSLSLMGYIKEGGLKCNYSTGNHGYIYQVDYLKFNRLDKDFWEDTDIEGSFNEFELVEPCHIPGRDYTEIEKDWLVEKQLNTINSKVSEFFSNSNLHSLKFSINK